MTRRPPCVKDCPRRSPTCHTECPEYLEFDAENKKEREAYYSQLPILDFGYERQIRRQKVARKFKK